jgi:hypothetical protein
MSNADNEQVVGLYSFPKSGNTWLRAIIASIVGIPEGPGNLHKYVTDTHYGPVKEHSWEFQDIDWFFYKSHHKRVLLEDKVEEFETDKVVYIYRHPLDVFMSYLNFVSANVSPQAGKHLPIQFDKVEDLAPDELDQLFGIYLEHGTLFPKNKTFGSQFENIKNFLNRKAKGQKVHILRYEDLSENFEEEVKKICDFLEFKDIDFASVFASADNRTKQNGKFFWKRKTGTYKEYLTPEQIGRFEEAYQTELTDLGYL